MYRKSLTLDEGLLRAEPTSVRRRRNVVVSHVSIGQASERSADSSGALEQYRLALPLVESLSAEDPANMQARSDLASVYQRIGTLMAQHGDPRGAAPLLERALQLLEDVESKDPSSLITRALVANTHTGLGYVHAALGAEAKLGVDERIDHYREAKDHFGQGLAFWTEARDRGLTTGEESSLPDQIARQVANCEQASASLGAAGR